MIQLTLRIKTGQSALRRTGLMLVLAFLTPTVMATATIEQSTVEAYTRALLAGESVPSPGEVINGHPAYPWLRMAWMRPRLGELDSDEVALFIARFRDRPFAAEFRREWLIALGREERWRAFYHQYRGERDPTLQCLASRARLAYGQEERALREAGGMWLTGRDLPAECEPLFGAAREKGAINDFMVRERYRMAMDRNNLSLAERLAPDVGDEAVQQVAQIRAIYRDPQSVMDSINPATATAAEVDRFTQAAKRLGRREPRSVKQQWQDALSAGLDATPRQRFMVERRLALEAAREHLPEASEWLAATSANDSFMRSWRIRNALRMGEWDKALAAIDSDSSDRSRQWQYWRARALVELDRKSEAEGIFRSLARQEDYYGLLAAWRLSEPPERIHRPIEADDERLAELSQSEHVQLARILFELDWPSAAVQEWRAALDGRDRDSRCQAALLASRWGWASEAVITAARAGCRGDPEVDYPLAFSELMKPRAEHFELDPAWAWSIMRAESLFATDARSHVGALGLMQLMPATASDVAGRLELELNGERDILEPRHNIKLGTRYLREMLDQFENHPLIATAAYNAGPHRAEAWMPRSGTVEGDVWAETIPFRETRQYIRRVMTHSLGYDQRLERDNNGLTWRLGPVGRSNGELCVIAELEATDETASC